MSRVLLCLMLCAKLTFSDFENVHKRHEYSLTFKSPVIILPNTNDIPFFEIGGHVIAGKERVRLTTSLADQQGWIWSKSTASFEGFQIDLVFQISGSSKIGADGLALWVVKDKSMGGAALGSSTIWNGLGIFFDTYDNDGQGNNPIVFAMYNDGTKMYDSHSDGKDVSAGHCIRDYRNRPHPVHARIIYFNETLELSISSGIAPVHPELEQCFKIHFVLPKSDYYFGLSAATGTLADDHDVEKFEVHSLSSLENVQADEEKKRLEEQKKYEEDFQNKLNNLTKAEETSKSPRGSQPEDENINKGLTVIFQEIVRQNKILQTMTNSIEEIRTTKFSNSSSNGEADLASQLDSMRKEFVGIKHSVDFLSRKIENPGNSNQQQQTLLQLQSTVDNLKSELLKEFEKVSALQSSLRQSQGQMQDKINSLSKDPANGSCISPILLVSICIVQVMCVIGFMVYQKNKENSAKKFY